MLSDYGGVQMQHRLRIRYLVKGGAVAAILAAGVLTGTGRSAALPPPGFIDVFAGGGVGDGGPALEAAISTPAGVVIDGVGDLYFSDTCSIRKISGGIVTATVGTGTCGFNADGLAPGLTQVNFPAGLALDSAGDLVFADKSNCRIRKVSAGVVTTIAGNGTCGVGTDGIAATASRLNQPRDVTFDALGDFYIADDFSCRIRKVTGGIITTVAGGGACGYSGDGGLATSAQLRGTTGISVTSSGDLYIADIQSCVVRVVSGGIINTAAGNGTCAYGGDGGLATASLVRTTDVFAVGTDVYLSDTANCRIRPLYHAIVICFDKHDVV